MNNDISFIKNYINNSENNSNNSEYTNNSDNESIISEYGYDSDTENSSSSESPVYRKSLLQEINLINKMKAINNKSVILTSKRGNNSDSSEHINEINLDEIKFDFNLKTNNSISNFYSIQELNSDNMNLKKLYQIFITSPLIVFVDNYKLNFKKKYKFYCKNKSLRYNNFQGCTFFPFEYKTKICDFLDILNKNILKSELENKKIVDDDNETCYLICFDEGEIFKNTIYRKIIITNKILFIPIEKYQLKITEYRIRGFCQIMEELGAKQIDINFINNTTKINKSNGTLNNDMEAFAGSLGFSTITQNNKSNEMTYVLTYPNNNTMLLDIKKIRKKIKQKKYIISEANYNSNLELQYVIASRCRHFITKYSTVFTFDNSACIDKKLTSKFKSHGIGINLNVAHLNSKSSNISIITNIIFSNKQDILNTLSGSNVSLDPVGFTFLINSFTESTFNTIGIYKIIEFINEYIRTVLRLKKSLNKYNKIKKIMKRIKREFTINEFAKILLNYFNCNSQWIHFINFINILQNESVSYDKLGYLIFHHNKIT